MGRREEGIHSWETSKEHEINGILFFATTKTATAIMAVKLKHQEICHRECNM